MCSRKYFILLGFLYKYFNPPPGLITETININKYILRERAYNPLIKLILAIMGLWFHI